MAEKKVKKTVKSKPKKTPILKEEQVMDGLNTPFEDVMKLILSPKTSNKK
jgi:hypothetical protein